jgi:hypothetical protein
MSNIFIANLDILGRDRRELFAVVVVTNLLHHVLIDWVGKVLDNLYVLIVEAFQERTLLDFVEARAGKDVDLLLSVLHVLNVLIQTDPVVARL